MSLGRSFRLPADVRPLRYALHFDLDLDAWTFAGRERIEITADSSRHELAVHAADLTIAHATAHQARTAFPAEISLDADAEIAVLRFAQALSPGTFTLETEFSGGIRADLKGLYRSTRREERYAVAILFAAEARRLFPCFDEPAFKARFTIELTAPAVLTAISNMRLAGREDSGAERSLWRFAETPPLSTYLLTIAVGPFEGTEVVRTRTGLPVRVWLPRGLARDGAFARDAHRAAVDWLEAYTGIPYPYDKVEGIGLPDFPAGAMENPGAITYRLNLMAADPEKTDLAGLKATVGVVCHELTHMWWGDLVTLAWWDDIWLNESFATFIGHKATDALHPEWRIWRDFAVGSTRGFALDALASTHAIHSDAATAEEALQRFDAISYQKGATVLRMIEAYLGEATFQRGVGLYLERFRESNATAADFWRALDDVSGQDVTRIASTWIGEPGHPVVELRLLDATRVTLRQRRFFLDPDAPPSAQRWPVPLVVRTAAGEVRALLDGEAGELELPVGAWIHPNAMATGFYRFALDAPLRERLLANLRALDATERLLVVDNEWALLRAGVVRVADHIALLRALEGEDDRVVLGVIAEQLRWLAVHVVTALEEQAFRALVGQVFEPHLARLGWDPRPDEREDDRQLRPIAVRALGTLAAWPEVRREAAHRVAAHLGGDPQAPDLIGACIAVAAEAGDAELHARYLARYRDVAGREPQEERRFLSALPLFEDPVATEATLGALFGGAIRDQDLPAVFFDGFRNAPARAAYWRAFRERYRERVAPLEALVRHGAVSSLAQLTPPALAAEADAFLAALDEPESQEIVARTRESLRLGADAAGRMRGELAVALTPRG